VLRCGSQVLEHLIRRTQEWRPKGKQRGGKKRNQIIHGDNNQILEGPEIYRPGMQKHALIITLRNSEKHLSKNRNAEYEGKIGKSKKKCREIRNRNFTGRNALLWKCEAGKERQLFLTRNLLLKPKRRGSTRGSWKSNPENSKLQRPQGVHQTLPKKDGSAPVSTSSTDTSLRAVILRKRQGAPRCTRRIGVVLAKPPERNPEKETKIFPVFFSGIEGPTQGKGVGDGRDQQQSEVTTALGQTGEKGNRAARTLGLQQDDIGTLRRNLKNIGPQKGEWFL